MARILFGVVALALLVGAAPPRLTDADRREVITNSARLIDTRYVDAKLGESLALRLRAAEREWAAIDDPKMFADAVTQWLRRESGDGHLGLSYSGQPIPDQGGESSFSAAE